MDRLGWKCGLLVLAVACEADPGGSGDSGDPTGAGATANPQSTDSGDDSSGPATSDPSTSGETTPGETAVGGTSSGETTFGGASSGDTTSGGASSGDTTSDTDGSTANDDSSTGAVADCPTEPVVLVGSYTIENALDTEALVGYTEVAGDLTIAAPGLPDLDGLECLERVGGDMEIWGTDVTTLGGLIGLSEVGGRLELVGNSDLQDLEGLANLTTVGEGAPLGHFEIIGNASLTDLSGLAALTTVGWSLTISSNGLDSFDGLGSVAVGGELRAEYNGDLVDVTGSGGVVAQTVYFQHDFALPCENAEATVVLMEANGFTGGSLIGDNLDGCGFSPF